MKCQAFIPPVVALLVAGGWIFSQRRALDSVENERSRALAQSAAASAPVRKAPALSTVDQLLSNSRPRDWKKIDEFIRGLNSDRIPRHGDEMSRISAAIAVMNPEEILAAFDEIPKTNPSRTELEDLLLAPLVKLAPELALERLGDRITSDPSTFDNLLADALCALTKTDPKKAAAWLDDKIDKGLFDSEVLGKPSQGWWRMESALIRAMLVTNPTEASRRAAGIDPKNREHILMSAMHSQIIEPAEQAAYGKLCREFLDDEKMLTIVGWMSVELRQDSYQEISAFWDRFGATRKERATVAAQVARKPIQRMVAQSRKVTPEDLDAMRAWVTSEGSRKVETITGGAIGEVANSKSAGIAEAMVLFNHYYEGNPNDGLIVGFLGWPVVQADKPLFQSLFQKLSNDRVRANLLKDL